MRNFKPFYFILSPLIMISAIVLFILDGFNVNVSKITTYNLKEL